MDLEDAVLYRMAYGLAHQFREANVHRGSGRWRSNAAAGGDVEAITTEVIHRRNIGDESRELAREAVEDALARRNPAW
jgi:hypothetical protein